jgi:UDP-N-acetylmuramyl tripeptide synthase
MIGVKPAYAASLSCAPASGAVGASVTVTGSAFLPNTQITILYDGVQATSCTSSAAGAFTASLLIPPSVRGAHTITAQDGTNTATTTYTMTASFTRAPTSGAVGTTITLTGYGFAASTAVTVTWDGSALTTSPTPL